MAILLKEEGLYGRSRLYATDMNETVLRRARAGIFPLKAMRQYTADYLKAGGTAAFSEYYTADYESAVFRPDLRENMIFAQHNLVTDGAFNEFQVIFCRNVMIYFNRDLQARVHDLFLQSLVRRGYLCLGAKETLRYTPYEALYEEVDPVEKIYRRASTAARRWHGEDAQAGDPAPSGLTPFDLAPSGPAPSSLPVPAPVSPAGGASAL